MSIEASDFPTFLHNPACSYRLARDLKQYLCKQQDSNPYRVVWDCKLTCQGSLKRFSDSLREWI